MKKVIFTTLLIIWMITIFMLSNQISVESNKTSGVFTEPIVEFIQKIINIPQEEIQELFIIISKIVRKIAHFTAYAIGGILAYCAYNSYKKVTKKDIKYILLFMLLYAISDEIHQYFVERQKCRNKRRFNRLCRC